MTKYLQNFQAKFGISPARAKGRGAQNVPDGSLIWNVVDPVLMGLVPGFQRPAEAPKPSSDSMPLAVWAVTSDSVKAYAEPANLAAIRWALRGTRQLVMAPILQIYQDMCRAGVAKDKLSPSRAALYLLSLDATAIAASSLANKMIYGTVGQNQCLYQPVGWITVERASPESDVAGFSIRGIVVGDKKAEGCFRIIADQWQTLMASPTKAEATQAAEERDAAHFYSKSFPRP